MSPGIYHENNWGFPMSDYVTEFIDNLQSSAAYEIALANLDESEQAKIRADIARLLRFHPRNKDFMVRLVSELQLLQDAGWSAAGIKSLFHYLRWVSPWDQGGEEFAVCQNLSTIYCRLASVFWPSIANGMMRLQAVPLDVALGVRIEPLIKGRKHYVRTLQCADGRPLTERWQPTSALPEIPRQVVPEIANEAFVPQLRNGLVAIKELVARCKKPKGRKLLAFVRHVKQHPEVLDFMAATALSRNLASFSLVSLWEYCRWMLQTRRGDHRIFMPNNLGVFYSRAIVMLHCEFNGRVEVNGGGDVNRLLGLKVADKKLPGDYAKRLLFADGATLESRPLSVRHSPQKTKVKKHAHVAASGLTAVSPESGVRLD
jgi:hypothetical protein